MTFGRWGFAATTRRANERGHSAFFVVSAVAAGSVVSSVPAADSGDRVVLEPARPNRCAPPGYGTVAFGAA
jgi:hypothetical protein